MVNSVPLSAQVFQEFLVDGWIVQTIDSLDRLKSIINYIISFSIYLSI